MSGMAANYASRYGDLHARHWWFRSREEYVCRWVSKLTTQKEGRRPRILDIGCGDGFAWNALQRYGNVEGIEPDENLVRPDSAHRERIEIAMFPGRPRAQRYDMLLMLDVLEHIEDDRKALAAAFDLLEPGGHLVLTVPALMILWSEFDVLNRHYRRYKQGPLGDLLEQAGFQVVSNRYYYFWPVLPMLARRLLFKAKDADDTAFINVPPAPVNRLLRLGSALEHKLTSRLPAPFGTSLIAVAQRPRQATAQQPLQQVG